jgi:hypothetical protein
MSEPTLWFLLCASGATAGCAVGALREVIRLRRRVAELERER